VREDKAELWAAALESGDYEQGVGALIHQKEFAPNREVTHCALGVLGEVWALDNNRDWPDYPAMIKDYELKFWPPVITITARATGEEMRPGDRVDMVTANDRMRLPFSALAEYIRQQGPDL
jgi:hypothetical protein